MHGKNYETNQSVTYPYNATLFVSQCAEIGEAQIKTFLSQHLAEMAKYVEENDEEAARHIRVITKGLRQESKKADALRYYYYGYYIRQQEEQLEKTKKSIEATKVVVLTAKKHHMDILRYLFESGCSQQKDISSALGIDKSNLNRIMNNLADNDLVVKLVGPKCAFFELSANGYTFVRQQAFASELPACISKKSPLENRIERFKKENQRSQEGKKLYNLLKPWQDISDMADMFHYESSVDTKIQQDSVTNRGVRNKSITEERAATSDISSIKSVTKSYVFDLMKGLEGKRTCFPNTHKDSRRLSPI